MADESVKISLEVATQAAELALKRFKGETDKATSAFDVFKGSLTAGIALQGLNKAFSTISSFVSSTIEESAKAQQSVTNMNVALQNAGLFSKAASQDFQAFGDSLEATTRFSGESAEGAVALLASLTNLDRDGIKQAVTSAADLAATLNIDLAAATDMIAKAVNGNTTAFKKLGLEIQSGSTDAERLTNTLQALSTQQGAAVSTANTYSGSLAKLDNAQSKLYESIGDLITQSPAIIEMMNSAAQTFIDLSKWITTNSDDIKLFGQSVAIASGLVAVGMAGIAIGNITAAGSFAVLSTAAATAWAIITAPITVIVASIAAIGIAIYTIVKYWDDIKIVVYEAVAATLEYAAVVASVVTKSGADALNQQAESWRSKAQAIRDNKAAIEEQAKAQADADANNQDEANAEKRKAKLKEEYEQKRILIQQEIIDKQLLNDQLALVDADLKFQLAEADANHNMNLLAGRNLFHGEEIQSFYDAQTQRLVAKQAIEQQELESEHEASLKRIALIQDEEQKRRKLREENSKFDLSKQRLDSKQQVDLLKQRQKTEETIDRNKVQNTRDTLSTISSLSQSGNKELAIVGKAAGLTQIAIDTPVAIAKALTLGPIIGPIAATAVGIAMAAQAARLTGLAFADGGVVGGFVGATTGPDNALAYVRKGEMYLNAKQQRNLFEMANGQGRSTDNSTTNFLLAELINAVKSKTIIEIDGREVVAVVRDGLASGRSL